MPMKRLFAMLLALGALVAGGCSEEDNTLSTQRTQMTTYLQSTHVPRLVPEEEVGEAGDVAYYSVYDRSVFRYIENVWNENRLLFPEVGPSSTVEITFRAYVFAFRNIPEEISERSLPFYSNDPAIANQMYEYGLTPGAWKFEPLRIDLGRDDILNGLREALIGCRERDRIEVYMTYDAAYGEAIFGIVPQKSPVAYFITIDSVDRNEE